MFIGRTDVEAETPVLWPPDAKNWLIWKDRDAGKDWGQEEKGTIEDEMVGWHHRLDGHGFGWTPGVGDGQGSLACCDSWGRKESNTTERLNWTEFSVESSALTEFGFCSLTVFCAAAFILPRFRILQLLETLPMTSAFANAVEGRSRQGD